VPTISQLVRQQVRVLLRAGITPAQITELTRISRRSVGRIEKEAPLAGRAKREVRLASCRHHGQHEPMFSQIKRAEVQVLRRAKISRTKVAALTGVSVRSIRRIEKEAAITSTDDRAVRKEHHVGRPPKAEPFRAFVAAVLKEQPELMSLELLRRAKLEGYTGSKTAFYALVASERPTKERPVVRFEGLPGEFSQHDFGEVEVTFINGTKKRVHFFASRLKYSRWAQVTLVPDQTIESLVRPLVEHFHAMGGVPLVAVFDRPKTVVLRSNEYNPTFAAVMLELGVGIELCAPRSGNQKGSVERIVGWVKKFLLQAAALRRRGRPPAPARRVARRDQYPCPLARHGRHARRAHRRRARADEASLGPTRRARAPHPHRRRRHRHGAARHAPVLDAPGGDRPFGHTLPLQGQGAHRRGALLVAARAALRPPSEERLARAPCPDGRGRQRQTRAALLQARATARAR
jgi:transposase